MPLTLVISVAGFDRSYTLLTGADGMLSYPFTPLPGESGLYTVRAVHPSLLARPVHGSFVIRRVTVSPGGFNLTISRNYEQTVIFTVTTGEGTDLTNLRLVVDKTMHPNGVFPQGLHVTLPGIADILSASSRATFPVTLWADNTAEESDILTLTVLSDDCLSTNGAGDCTDMQSKVWGTVLINTHFSEALPVLSLSPTYLETGLAHDDSVTETVTVTNTGLAPLEEMALSLLADANDTPAPGWVSLLSSSAPGDLAVGERHEAAVAFYPDSTVAEDLHQFMLRVTSANHPPIDIGLYATVTQSGQGNVLFKLSDIYTGTLDEHGQPIQGLTGAKVKMQHEMVWSIEKTLTTDNFGEALFVDLPVGRYRYRINAADHEETAGWCWIKPGITTTQEIFLDYELVTVEWEVKEITIDDTYDIVLNTTYKTNVPAAVVVADPASVSLPVMQPGGVFHGEITLTNHGLIQAEQVVFALPADDQYFAYALLTKVPETIAAGASVTIPYRVTSLHPVAGGDDGNSSGGGSCGEYTNCSAIVYVYECVNGQWVLKEQQATCFTSVPPQCLPSQVGPAFSPSIRKSTQKKIEEIKEAFARQHGGSGSSVLVTKRPPDEIDGTFCAPTPPGPSEPENPPPTGERNPDTDDPPALPRICPPPGSDTSVCLLKDTEVDRYLCASSSVDLVQREYQRDTLDLFVETPLGGLPLRRVWKDQRWFLGPANLPLTRPEGLAEMPQPSLEFLTSGEDEEAVVSAIIKDGTVVYSLPDGSYTKTVETLPDGSQQERSVIIGSAVYLNGTAKIRRLELSETETSWLWSTEQGYWKRYDENGHFLEFGNESWYGQEGTRWYYVLYDDATGRMKGYADTDGQQRIWFEYDERGLLAAVHDGGAQRVEYGYDGDGRLITVRDVNEAITRFTYDEAGRLRTVTKPSGVATTISYGASHTVSRLEDNQGNITLFSYDYDKRREEYYASVTFPSGEIKEVWFDHEGDTTRVDIDGTTIKTIEKDEERNALIITDQYGQQTRKEYDEWDKLKTVRHPDGSETRYDYDLPKHRLIRKDGRGVVTEYGYNEDDTLSKLVEAVGTEQERITEYEYRPEGTRSVMRRTENANSTFRTVTEERYNEDGNRMQLKEAMDSAFERVTDYAYDVDGNMSTITKHLANGQTAVTEMQYDAEGNLSWKRGPDGQEISYSYVDGQLESVTTTSGTWNYAYDDEGRVTTVSDPFGNTRGREYDGDGNVTAVTVNGQTVGTYSYVNGLLLERTDAAGNTYRFSYNENNQLSRQQDPEGRSLYYDYDEQGRLIHTTDGSGNAIIREYGPVSEGSSSSCTSCSGGLFSRRNEGVERLQKIIYPTFTKEFRYDAEGRVSEELYMLDGGETYSVSYSYDQFGRLQSTTGPDGSTTTYHYDLLGRKIMVTGDAGHVEFEYDTWDNLTSLSDAKGQVTEFVYDTSGRLTQEIRPMQQSAGYEYDNLGRLQKILDVKNQTTEYGYDSQGRIDTISYDDGRSVTLSYDANDNLAGYDDGVTSASYTYDDLGRKLSETVNYGTFTKTFSYTYYTNGLKQSFTAPDSTTYEYAYGANNELREVRIPGLGSITISDYQWNRPKTMLYPGGSTREYEYDPLMRLTRLVATDPGGNALLDYSYEYDTTGNIVSKNTEHGMYSYGYDGASRLTSVDNPILDDESYSYDAVGNRTSASNANGSITHNANNELTVYGDVEYVYDANGNMVQKTLGGVAMNYIYNAENRLVKVEDELTGLVIAEYDYDPFGRRLWKEVGGTRAYFFYSDEGLIAEYNASGTELRSYGYRSDSTWTTDPLWLKQGSEYYFYQNDHLGTPQKLVKQNGAVVWSASFTAFGQASVDVETITTNLRFPGQYFDAETGLHYNWHRYYDGGLGRYLEKDPKGLRGGINLFAYAFNNPGKNSDPLGLGVHAHQIIPADEAERMVREVSERFPEMYLEAWLRLNVYQRWRYPVIPPTRLLLKWLGAYVFEPGAGKNISGYHNRFVFTCKYGWIDMGHFFNTARVGYWLEKRNWPGWATDWIPIKGWEYLQNVHLHTIPFWLRPNAESAFTTEDWWSNILGTQFGRELAAESPYVLDLRRIHRDLSVQSAWETLQDSGHDVAKKWYDFLERSGAVTYEEDDWVDTVLQEDAMTMWETYNTTYLADPQHEDPRATFNDEYRVHWEEIKCQSVAYQQLCCCTDSVSACQQKCQTGECRDIPIDPRHGFPVPPSFSYE